MTRESPSLLKHVRDILILPFTVTVVVPLLIYTSAQHFIPDNFWVKAGGIIIAGCGLTLFLYTVFLFRTVGKGTLAPWAATQKLVVQGPYRFCRNPMITSVFFVLIGESFVFHSTNFIIWAGVFFVINTLYFLLKEEPDLHKRFGTEYLEYKRNVPRWIPRLTPHKSTVT